MILIFSIKNDSTQLFIKILEEISFTVQSIPSTSPSPVTALHGMIAQCLVVMESSSKNF